MNKSNVPTNEKIMIPLRLPPDVYIKLMEEVQKQKRQRRGFSVNEYLTDILIQKLKEIKMLVV